MHSSMHNTHTYTFQAGAKSMAERAEMFKQRILQNFEAERAAQKKMDEAQKKVGGLARTYALARAHIRMHACTHAHTHTG